MSAAPGEQEIGDGVSLPQTLTFEAGERSPRRSGGEAVEPVDQQGFGRHHREHLIGVVRPVRRGVEETLRSQSAGDEMHQVRADETAFVVPRLGPGVGEEEPDAGQRVGRDHLLQDRNSITMHDPHVIQLSILDPTEEGGNSGGMDLDGENPGVGVGLRHLSGCLTHPGSQFDDDVASVEEAVEVQHLVGERDPESRPVVHQGLLCCRPQPAGAAVERADVGHAGQCRIAVRHAGRVADHVVMLPGWLEPPEVPGVAYVFWDAGEPLPPEQDLARVTVFVPPYMDPHPEMVEQLPALREVQALMAGVDGIVSAVPEGVELRRAAGLHDTSTAELAVGLMIAQLRGIDDAARAMITGTWDHRRRPALADRTVGIVGWGGVGQAVGARLAGFEVQVVPISRSGSDGARPVTELDALLPELDVVVLCTPLDESTRHLLDARRLALLPDGALVVNVGRGALVDTSALIEELRSGRLRAALDVTDPEPLPPGHALWHCPNLLITPHVGGDSEAFVPRARRLIADRITRLG